MAERRQLEAIGVSGPSVFFYVQHLLGIGHIARASRIASALVRDGCRVTLVTGGMPVAGFPGDDVTSIALPPVAAATSGFSGLAHKDGTPVDQRFLDDRRDRLLAAFHAAKPDVVIIEAYPFGRRQMRFELLPLIDAIGAARPRPKLFTSVRDILQQQKKAGRDEETVAALDAHFDGVLVHGDPGFVRLEETFPLAGRIVDKISYTGLVAPPMPPEPSELFDIVVSAGGGAVGRDLIRASLEAGRRVAVDKRWCLIAGPNLPEGDFLALQRDASANMQLVRFRKDFPSLLRGAQLSISQAGYNTVCDLLVTGCRSILVPFTAGGETEQSVRAERLQTLGLATALPEAGLTVDMLSGSISGILEKQKPTLHPIDLNGAGKTAYIVRNAA
jgi:predicted glycosyltransferase